MVFREIVLPICSFVVWCFNRNTSHGNCTVAYHRSTTAKFCNNICHQRRGICTDLFSTLTPLRHALCHHTMARQLSHNILYADWNLCYLYRLYFAMLEKNGEFWENILLSQKTAILQVHMNKQLKLMTAAKILCPITSKIGSSNIGISNSYDLIIGIHNIATMSRTVHKTHHAVI